MNNIPLPYLAVVALLLLCQFLLNRGSKGRAIVFIFLALGGVWYAIYAPSIHVLLRSALGVMSIIGIVAHARDFARGSWSDPK